MKTLQRTRAAFTAFGLITPIVPAMAADPGPYVPVVVPAWTVPVYDWNGFYVGAHVGGAFEQRNINTGDLATTTGSDSSFVGGGQVGVNFALWPHWMVGMEADITGAFLHGSDVASNGLGTVVQNDYKTETFGTARGRTGYIWNNWLIYVTGGYAWAYQHITRNQVAGTIGTAAPGAVESEFATATGWVVGGGLEWGFAPHWSARLEYLHLDVGPQTFSFPASGVNRNVESTIDVVRAGLNYKFNPAGP